MRKSTLFASLLAMFAAAANSFAQSTIELTTDMSVGSEFQIFLQVGEGESLKIDGLKGQFKNDEWNLVTLTKQNVKITRVRDNFSMKRVPTALIFLHIPAAPPAYSQKSNMQ